MPKSQRTKGKVVERQACHMLSDLGFTARRERQNDGKLDPDIIFVDHKNWWCEVKGVKTFRPWHQQAHDWIEKNETDAPPWAWCFVLAKVHGAGTWGLGWKAADGRHMWTFGTANIKMTLEDWVANLETSRRLVTRTADCKGA